MNRAFLTSLLGALLLLTGACKSRTDNKDAIRAGVVKHIASMKGLNVNNMDVVVTQARVNGNSAEASVDIRAKGGDPKAPPMQLVYQMQKQGDEWVVIKGQPTGGMAHPAPGEAPPPGATPPGSSHPDFNSILNTAQPPAQQAPAQQPSAPQQSAQQPSGSYSK